MQAQTIIPVKSPNDDRTYQAVTLGNGIKVLFVHDARAEKGACSVSVGVGSLRDGERSLGLAHFLQHMLFMGSRRFPRHNEYSEFISLNSGMDNAWTSDEETNYYFEIANAKFLQGVERLADFFVEALLTQSCVEKQRQAVHEECQLRCGEDNSRKWEILKHFASGPYHNHSIGNNQTLNNPHVVQDLREFYKNQYSANRINAVLLSALPIEQMKAKAVPYFLEITNKQLPPIDYELHFLPANLGKLVRMRSIKDESILQFFWAVNPLRPHHRHHPQKYITHVLGHEGKHSLLSLLKEREYASKIVSYSHDLPRQSIVGLEIQLTEVGVEDYQKVYNLVTDYCCWLRADQQVYNEIRDASAVAFQFKEKSPNYQYSTELSSSMHHVDLKDVISWRANYADFDQALIDGFLRQLNPFNLLLVYSNSEELEDPIVEKHLGGNFVIRDLPARVNEGVTFHPLRKNPFLPLSTALTPADPVQGIVVHQGNVYYSRGKETVCKGGVQLLVHSPQKQVFLELYSAFLELLFKETTYEAETLKLQVNFQSEDRLSIDLFGFSDTVQKLLAEMAPRLAIIHRDENAESLFELAREDLIQEYENFYMGDVDEIADTHLDILLTNTSMPVKECLEELEGYEYITFYGLIEDFWKRARLEWVVVGNFPKEFIPVLNAHELNILRQERVACPPQPLLCARIQRPLTQVTKLQAEDIATSGVIKYHEVGPYSEPLHYTLSLLVNYIKEPYFDKLRTEKQLAYYLRAYQKHTRGVIALCFLLVSSNTDPRAVSKHIEDFANAFLSQAENDLAGEKFQSIKNSVRTKELQPHNSLRDYFHFICREIDRKTFLFTRKQRETLQPYLSSIVRQDVIALLRRVLEQALQVWVVAKNHQEEFQKKAEDFQGLESIKAGLEYYVERENQYQA